MEKNDLLLKEQSGYNVHTYIYKEKIKSTINKSVLKKGNPLIRWTQNSPMNKNSFYCISRLV